MAGFRVFADAIAGVNKGELQGNAMEFEGYGLSNLRGLYRLQRLRR